MYRILYVDFDPESSLFEDNFIIPKIEPHSFKTSEDAVNFIKNDLFKLIRHKYNSEDYEVNQTENSMWITGEKCPRVTIDVVCDDRLFERYEYVVVDTTDKYIHETKK